MRYYFTYLRAKEVSKYPLEYTWIPHVQKVHQVQSASSTKLGYLDLLQFGLVYTYFYSR